MKEKNRFSGRLKHLMTVAKLKNYTLAKELQYDESYISKWVTGSLLPTEKTSEKVIRDISHCVVTSADEEARELLFSEYQVDSSSDLEDAIFDNLIAEFNYVMDLKESTGSEIAQKTTYYPELTLAQFMQKMHHPVLRQVKSLDVIMATDILSLDRHYQLTLAEMNGGTNPNVTQRSWPGVHFTMLINLDAPRTSNSYNVPFLLNLLTNFSNVDFQLYTSPQTQGKLIFAVKNSYSISGMIMDESHCLAVTTSEEPKNCNAIYDRLQSLCSQETMAVRRVSMSDMLRSNEYMQHTFARNQRWLLSHYTEHFLPDELFEELAEQYCRTHPDVSRASLTRMHMLSRNILEHMDIKAIISENALSEFALSGMVDFFNNKVYLSAEQRLQCMRYMATLPEKNPRLNIRILREGTFSDLQHVPNPTLFLSDSACHLRLSRIGPKNNVTVLNKAQVCDMFREFFDDLWNDGKHVYREPAAIADLVVYAQQMITVQIQIET